MVQDGSAEYSLKSARLYRAEQLKKMEIYNPERHTDRLMEAMKRELNLDREPRHIECFDNSNLQGTNPVASCVVFKDGKPSKRDYRHFNVKTVEGPDDFASMREIITRRYGRFIAENQQLPDLIIVDGVDNSHAYRVLCDLGIEDQVPLIGLADQRSFIPTTQCHTIYKKGEPLRSFVIFVMKHTALITFHRQKRSNTFLSSELDQIKGVGSKSVTALLKHFGSVKGVKAASLEQLSKVIGESKAKAIREFFESN